MSLSRVFLYSSALTFVANYAVAKYCVKLPTCEELGYIYSADKYPNNRSIKCPFDTKKILLLDYCQAYGLTSCDSTSGECDECIVEKADGTKSNSGYWRYTRCNAGYSYKSGECPPTEVNREQYPYEGSEGLDESIGEIECVQSAQNTYCGYKSCNEGWNLNSGNCIVHDCGSSYPYTSCDENGICEECKAGFNMKYSAVTCNSGYYNIDNKCHLPCSTPGTCDIGDIYAYNGTPIGVVFFDDGNTTKIIALRDINSEGKEANDSKLYWSTSTSGNYGYNITTLSDINTPLSDMDGKGNTEKAYAYISANNVPSQTITAIMLYAPQICNSTSFCGVRKWYLPAAGEFGIIADNYTTMQNAVLAAGGGIFHQYNFYWTSSKYYFSSGNVFWTCLVPKNTIGYWHSYNLTPVRPALQINK